MEDSTYDHIVHSHLKETRSVRRTEKFKQGLDLLSESFEPLNRIVIIPTGPHYLKPIRKVYRQTYKGVIP